jgi:hypothetical protein
MWGTWTWYANWSTGLLASSPLVAPSRTCALSLAGGAREPH